VRFALREALIALYARRLAGSLAPAANPSVTVRLDKKFNLNTLVRETVLQRRHRGNRYDGRFDYDWSAMRYNRKALVNRLLSTDANDYLEIGCAGDELFDAVMAERKVGVDPARGGTHRQTSDAFFAGWKGGEFDVVFIDGLHHYEQVRRDLIGALRRLRPGGWIALHDMLPRSWLEEHVPQLQSRGWTGDGWKVAFELLASPDIDFRLVAIDHGIVVVRPLVERPFVADLSATLTSERFAYLHRNFTLLPVVGYHEASAWIASHQATRGAPAPPSAV
jgi:SAM-dependent methyltransferase